MVSLDDDASAPVGEPAPGSSDPTPEESPSHIDQESPSGVDAVEGGSGTPEEEAPRRDGVASSNLDRWLNMAIVGVIVLIVVVGGYFGYTYYYQQQQARLANPALHLIDVATAAAQKDPKNPDTHARLAEALAANGDYAQAKQELATALKLQPDYAVAYQDLSEIALDQNDSKNAQIYLTKLLTVTSTGEFQGVNDRREFALYNLGALSLQQKKYTDAIGYLNAAIRVNNTASDSYLLLAKALHGSGDDAGALKNVGIALQFDPNYAEALYFQGTLYQAAGDIADAAWDFRASLGQAPDQAEPKAALAALGTYDQWLQKGQAAYASGDLKSALADAEVARAIQPSGFDAAMLNGEVLVKQGSYADAVEAFKVAVKVQPKDTSAAAALQNAQTLAKGSNSK
jgi:tetratricopeptide (TPR) repeat protein